MWAPALLRHGSTPDTTPAATTLETVTALNVPGAKTEPSCVFSMVVKAADALSEASGYVTLVETSMPPESDITARMTMLTSDGAVAFCGGKENNRNVYPLYFTDAHTVAALSCSEVIHHRSSYSWNLW